jgi:hypothetical protein
VAARDAIIRQPGRFENVSSPENYGEDGLRLASQSWKTGLLKGDSGRLDTCKGRVGCAAGPYMGPSDKSFATCEALFPLTLQNAAIYSRVRGGPVSDGLCHYRYVKAATAIAS